MREADAEPFMIDGRQGRKMKEIFVEEAAKPLLQNIVPPLFWEAAGFILHLQGSVRLIAINY